MWTMKLKIHDRIKYYDFRGEVLTLPDESGELKIRLDDGKILFVFVEELEKVK